MNNSSVCFLVINKISVLPSIAIESCLKATNSDLYIGYVSKSDIDGLPINSRIRYVDLSEAAQEAGVVIGEYKNFTQDEFFKLVVLKWALISSCLRQSDSSFVIYSDLDVMWLNNPVGDLSNSFSRYEKVQIYVQDFTSNPALPNLCMGFAAFRNSTRCREVVAELNRLHLDMLQENSKFGDDDVVTRYFREHQTVEISLLPQSTFPVGSMGKLFSRKTFFPGIGSPKPYIFHANFVVGNANKVSYLVLISQVFAIQLEVLTKRRQLGFLLRLILKKLKVYLQV